VALPARTTEEVVAGPGGVIGSVAEPLFRDYLLAFELTSMLLLTAIVGAVVIGKKRS
jgi:NADH-quinone oxidoreductase subunit J